MMKAIYYTLSVTWKEIQLMLRERGVLAVYLLLPLLLSSLMGGINIMTNAEDEAAAILLHVCLVNQDADGAYGIEVAKALQSIDELDVEVYETAVQAEDRVAKGEAAAAIIIPAGFSKDIYDYTPTAIEVIVDPGQAEGASIVAGIMNQVVAEVTIWGEVQYGIRAVLDESGALAGASAEQRGAVEAQTLGVVMTALNEMRRTPAIAVASEDLEGTQDEGWIEAFFAMMFPAITVLFIFFGVAWLAPNLLKEREAGTLRRLLAAPVPRGAIIAGKMLAFVLLACVQVVVMFSVAHIGFNMPLGRAPLTLVVLTLVVAFVSTALGIMIAALAKTAKQADGIGTLMSFVLGGIGGCIGAREPFVRSGGILGILSSLTPHGHAVEAYYRVMAENGTLVDILPQVGILLAMGVVFFGIAVWRFKFE
ncbi:MAG: ABC transporter permease [Anaerolineae bacterium]|jgi:ABC-2 type transport system permease protein